MSISIFNAKKNAGLQILIFKTAELQIRQYEVLIFKTAELQRALTNSINVSLSEGK